MSDNGRPPTSVEGLNPAAHEARVLSVLSPTELTIDTPSVVPLSGQPYVLSDRVDVEPGPMYNYFLRLAWKNVRQMLRMEGSQQEYRELADAMMLAKEADSRYHGHQGALSGNRGVRNYRVNKNG